MPFDRKAYMHAYNKRRREEHLRRAFEMMGERKSQPPVGPQTRFG